MADLITEGLHGCSREESYVVPPEPEVRAKLEWFRDQKLALMAHFGPYSQLGICESWPLSDGDASWARRGLDWEKDPQAFKRQYFDLNKSFNPARVEPEKWADFALENGFKYFIFTTKHHDGFCMYDSKYSPYKLTATDCPFHTHRYADLTRRLFDAFRARGLGIAAYFSKPDWHCPWYWAEGMDKAPATDRNPTYDTSEHPEVWERFVSFVHAQLTELADDYGPLDILWLDGGQVRPDGGQDARIPELAAKLRRRYPGLLVADRTVGGPCENYVTPEQSVPAGPISVPWESCVTIGTGFSFRYEDRYKTPRELVRLLTDVVSRGGNLALNIGPQPDGRLPRGAVESASGLGAWLRANGEAIYFTRAFSPCQAGRARFTRGKEAVYAILPLDEGEALGAELAFDFAPRLACARLLGAEVKMEFAQEGGRVTLTVPEALRGSNPLAPAIRLELA